MRSKSQSIRYILAATVALSWFTLVKAETPICQDVEETVIIQPQATSYRIIPGEYEWVDGEIRGYAMRYKLNMPRFDNGKLVAEAYPITSFKAYEIRDGRTRIQTKRPEYEAITLPAQTKTYSRAGQCSVVSSETAGG